MAKKDRITTVNNINELNLEIDYDKLAEAIVKAQDEVEKHRIEKKSYVSSSFTFWISLFFRVVPIIGITICIIGLITIIQYEVCVAVWNTAANILANIYAIGIDGLSLIALGAYCIIMWKAAKELEQEKDRNFIVAVFSGIVSFAALIVALVALLKGVR